MAWPFKDTYLTHCWAPCIITELVGILISNWTYCFIGTYCFIDSCSPAVSHILPLQTSPHGGPTQLRTSWLWVRKMIQESATLVMWYGPSLGNIQPVRPCTYRDNYTEYWHSESAQRNYQCLSRSTLRDYLHGPKFEINFTYFLCC